MKRLRVLCIVLIAIVSISNYAQDINFDDLQRSGSPLAKNVSINGLAAEGLRYRDQFIRNDDVRVEEYNQALSRYSSSSSSSSGSSSSSSSSSSNGNSRSSSSSAAGNKGPSTTQRIRSHRDGDLEFIYVSCANSGKERHYQYNRKTNRYCTPSLSCDSEDWVIRAICN